ncbi:MAG: MATE family efflux transporter [Ruminococcus sp.]|nr:MATE family efflux transporter [Ruminococcus sp.]
MTKTYDLTNGKPSKLILTFFFPMLMTNMLQQVYAIADTAIVGKGLGDNALAAVGNISSLTFLIIGFSMGLGNGFNVLTAQSFGAGDHAKLRRYLGSSIRLCIVIAGLLTALSVIFLKDILILLQTDKVIMSDSLSYGLVIFGGLSTAMLYNMCSGVLRALGDSKTPLIAIIISTIVNIVLDCGFIFLLKTGVWGAAAATVMSQLLSSAVCLYKLHKIEFIRLSRADFAFSLKLDAKLLKNGIPMALMNSITAIGCMTVQYFVNGLGVAYTSAYSACSRFINMFIQPACTAGYTMSSFASQNYGAKKYSRISDGMWVCIMIAGISYLLLGSVMVFAPKFLGSILIDGDEPINIASQYFRICGVAQIAVDFLFIFRSCVQGLGKPFIPMISGIAEMVLRVGVIVIFIGGAGFAATAYAEIAAWTGALLINAGAYFYITRRKLGISRHRLHSKHAAKPAAEIG